MVTQEQDAYWMKLALAQAKTAMEQGEVPVGALIVHDGHQIAATHNLRQTQQIATAHAEILAIEEACRVLHSKHLCDCTLYVTLEPCPMCAGALAGARIGRIVFAAKDPRAGACGSLLNLFAYPLEAKPEIKVGVLEEESLALLRTFFANFRAK